MSKNRFRDITFGTNESPKTPPPQYDTHINDNGKVPLQFGSVQSGPAINLFAEWVVVCCVDEFGEDLVCEQ